MSSSALLHRGTPPLRRRREWTSGGVSSLVGVFELSRRPPQKSRSQQRPPAPCVSLFQPANRDWRRRMVPKAFLQL